MFLYLLALPCLFIYLYLLISGTAASLINFFFSENRISVVVLVGVVRYFWIRWPTEIRSVGDFSFSSPPTLPYSRQTN